LHMSKRMKKATIAIVLALLTASIAISANVIQPASAQLAAVQPTSGPLPAGVTVDNTVDTIAYMSARPKIVGLNQAFLVNIWTSPSTHVERFHPGYQVTITKPDGKTDVVTMNSYCADASNWFEYIADQIGTWKLKFDFKGTYFPAGRYLDGYIVTNSSGELLGSAYYKPSSTGETTITVQQNMVASWPASPLPTDYWTRPIPPEYREWWTIAGNFPWFGPGGGTTWDQLYPNTNPYRMGISREPMARFAAWVQAPNSGHVVWKREAASAGIVGGDKGQQTLEGNPGYPAIILFGKAYQSVSKVNPSGPTAQNYWQCYDIRTGEIFWERPMYSGESAPTLIEYSSGSEGGENVGAVPGAGTSPRTPSLLSISGNYMRKYNPDTGAMASNTSIAPLNNARYYMNGYALTVQTINATAGKYRLINWTTFGTGALASRIVSNISWPWSDLGNTQDFNVGIAVSAGRPESGNAFVGTELAGANMRTGAEIWRFVTPWIETSSGAVLVEGGKLAMGVLEDRMWVCWDVYTGNKLWESEKTASPWGNFWSYSSESAYGMIYSGTYEGLYAFDWDTGKIVWKFEAPANPFETPYVDANGTTVYSWHSSLYVADGKIFSYNCEHTPGEPITRGWKWFAINATTGEEIWNLPGCGVDSRVFQGAMADGYLAMSDRYSGAMFVVGKGKSATTVTAPNTVVAKGSGIVIQGTVLDKSPAQPDTPCVSKDSMSTWMAYLHWQWPIDGFTHNETITGVPVALTALGSDGSSIDLGTVTTDGYYGTFSKTWTPPAEGDYKIIASFAGDDSYGSSSASTAISVGPAPAEITIPEQATPIDYTMTIVGVGIALAIVVIVAVAVSVLVLRKK
jgi:PQQ-like domain